MIMHPSELPSEYDKFGFDRADFMEFLSFEGIHISEASNAAPSAKKLEVPEWAKSSKAIKRFTLDEAADILIGLDPWHQGWRGEDGEREFSRICTALAQAAEDGDLPRATIDDRGHSSFNAQDLRAWAESAGFNWCIPSDAPAKAPAPADSATLNRLHQLEADKAALAERVAELERRLAEATAAPQIPPQETGQAPQQATAAPQLEADKLHPRRETTYLNTIGVLLAMVLNPRQGRAKDAAVIREMVSDFGDKPGISGRSLQDVFAAAKRSLDSI